MKRKLVALLLVIMLSMTLIPIASLAVNDSDDSSVVFDGYFNFSSATIDGLNVGGSNELTMNLYSTAAVEGVQVRVYAVRYIPGYNSTDMPRGTNIPGGVTLMTNEIGHYFDHYQAIPHLAADVTVNLAAGANEHTVRLNQILYQTLATTIEVELPVGATATVTLEGTPVATLNVPGINWSLLHTLVPTPSNQMSNLPQVVPDSIRIPADDPYFSLAEQYRDFFQIGNVNTGIVPGTGAWARRHFNTLTAENHHKPSFLQNAAGNWTLANMTSNNLINYAIANNVDVVGHVLIWHGQSQNLHHPGPGANREQAMQVMENYIRTVLTHFDQHVFPPESPRAGERIFSAWDVVNEAFINEIPYVSEEDMNTPGSWKQYLRKSTQTVRGWENAPGSGAGHLGGAAMANRHHWYDAFANGADLEAGESGADFIYYSFVFARRYSDTVLVYNDFNIYEQGKALMVAQMVSELNERYAREQPNYEFFGGPDHRQLIEVVGMQGHWYIQDTPARDPQRGVQMAIDIMREIGVRVHISELDLFVHFPYGAQGGGHFGAPQLRNWTGAWLDNSEGNEPYWRLRFGLPTDQPVPPELNFGKYIEAVQAQTFAEIFTVLKENADIIDRVTFWGLRDNNSWRAALAPLLWYADVAGQPNPKLAYYAVAFPTEFLGLDPIAPPEQSVNLVRVTPASIYPIRAGHERSFTAGVFGNRHPVRTVTWEVEGGMEGTYITDDGVLVVAADELAERLIIRATSTFDTSVYGIAVMQVYNMRVELGRLVYETGQLDRTEHPASGWTRLMSSVIAANRVLDNENATSAQIEAAFRNLTTMLNNLR